MNPVNQIITHANFCFLPKLARNVEEIDIHPEYHDPKNQLEIHLPPIMNILSNIEIRSHPQFSRSLLPTLIILYVERSCPAPWNNDKCMENARKLNRAFQSAYRLSLDSVLLCREFCNVQDVFDNVLNELNRKAACSDFKKYPGQLKVYSLMLNHLKTYKVTLNPVTIFPIALLLSEDYVDANKLRGLRCCLDILQCLTEKHFEDGNYYEVIFSMFKKLLSEKKLDILSMVHDCILQFIQIVPADVKEQKTDEIFGSILEQIHMESNLHRKTVCFGFMKNIIKIHKVNCVNKRLLKVVLWENVDICCNDAVADILLVDVLETLQVWLKYCWCVWKFSSDHKLLLALIKLLYVSRKEKIAPDIQHLIVALILLCSKEERLTILKNLEDSEITVPEFQEKLDEIKRDISD